MEILDPGHKFKLVSFDGDLEQILTFMKREGPNYPGNIGHYPGTNIQEVCRALISRSKYLNNQQYSQYNESNIILLEEIIYNLECRAAYKHERLFLLDKSGIATRPFHKLCGHIDCTGNCHATTKD